jgi:Spy/CpxP family protein refolding chaperone
MKKLLIGLIISAVAVFSAGTLIAGGGYGDCGEPGYGGGHHGKKYFMKKELALTEKQEQQMFDIGTKYRQKFFDNRNDPDKIKALREEKRKEMDSVLTKEQLEKLKKLHDQRGHRGRGHGHYSDEK